MRRRGGVVGSHLECDDLARSMRHLKQKQDAGASFFVTQLFFDNDYFYRFRELADSAGITVPITAGIMPFMGKQQISAWCSCAAPRFPLPFIKLLARLKTIRTACVPPASNMRAASLRTSPTTAWTACTSTP